MLVAPSTWNTPRGEVKQKDLTQAAHARCSHLPGLFSLLQLCSQQAVAASSSAGLQSLVTHWLMSFTEWYLRRHCRAWQQFLCTKPALEISAQLLPCQHCNHIVQRQRCPKQHTDTGKHLCDLPKNSLCTNLKIIWANADKGRYRKVPCSITEVTGGNSGASSKPSTSSGCYREQGFQRHQ